MYFTLFLLVLVKHELRRRCHAFRQRQEMIVQQDKKQADEAGGQLMHTLSRSLIDKELESFRANFQRPTLLEVSGDARIFNEECNFERLFNSIREYCDSNEIADVVSMIESADYLSDAVIGITGVICFMQTNNVRFKSPFPIYLLAKRCSDAWKISCFILPTIDEPELAAAFKLN